MGTKRSVLTDEKGLPLAVILSGANTHDVKLLADTLDGVIISRPEPNEEAPQISAWTPAIQATRTKWMQEDILPEFAPGVRRKKNGREIRIFGPAAGLLKPFIPSSTVSVSYWFALRKRPLTTLLSSTLPALLLFGADYFPFIFNFGISSKYGEETIFDGYRIFHVCPYCGHEINNKVGPVDDNGNPIPLKQ